MATGFTGISFPFRLGNKGGIVMSSTTTNSAPHIEESIEQILTTRKGERVMEYNIGSELDTQIFEPNEPATHNLIKFQIVEALSEQEPRIEVKSSGIDIYSEGNSIYADITYTVIQFNTTNTHTFRIGGVVDEG